MSDLGGRELLAEWRKAMDSLLHSATALGADAIPRQLLERQLELVAVVLERERSLQGQLATHLLAPADAVFELLEQSGLMLRRQAEALESAGRALQETAILMKNQAELFERTVGLLREPAELAKRAAGVEPRPRKGRTRRPRS